MTVALCASAIVVLALLWEISLPWLERRLDRRKAVSYTHLTLPTIYSV